jgi:hypothetical protein
MPAGERKELENRLRQLREALEKQGNDEARPD